MSHCELSMLCLQDSDGEQNTSLHRRLALQSLRDQHDCNDLEAELVDHVKRLRAASVLQVLEHRFEVLDLLNQGAHDHQGVHWFSARDCETGRKVALKQERPTNYWEYYICLEIHKRLKNEMMLPAFPAFEHALIADDSAVFVTEFFDYSSLSDVLAKIKSYSTQNVHEYVVMLLSCQLLEVVHHLHAANIVHANLKAVNVLLMKPLSHEPDDLCLQLINFSHAFDMKLLPPHPTTPAYACREKSFKCAEMRNSLAAWPHKLDYYGLAGVIHELLLGRALDEVQWHFGGIWLPKTTLPRYVNKQIWDLIFKGLLNLSDSRTSPDLQQLRALLKSELAEHEKIVAEAVAAFNRILKM